MKARSSISSGFAGGGEGEKNELCLVGLLVVVEVVLPFTFGSSCFLLELIVFKFEKEECNNLNMKSYRLK